ncbi:MAG: hypothetical protein JWP01_738 [Myxococcales bacterium]|nr:hypothetical protein [Myxococcales bacterium]
MTTVPELLIPLEQFDPAKEYVITIEAHLGYPHAATGDLGTVVGGDGISATSLNYSGVFRVGL